MQRLASSTLFPYTTLFRSRMMLTYLTCFVIFIVYPVYGPGLTLPRYSGPLTDGLFYRLVRASLGAGDSPDRKSTRLNSSHTVISYAVFCVKKKSAQTREMT